MTKSWGAAQKHEILRQHDDSTATTDETDPSSQIPGFPDNCLLSRFHSSTLLLLKRLKVAAASLHQYSWTDVSPSQIRWPWLSNIFDDVLQRVGPNKEAASCWENNFCLVLLTICHQAWLLSTKAFGQNRTEPGGIRRHVLWSTRLCVFFWGGVVAEQEIRECV